MGPNFESKVIKNKKKRVIVVVVVWISMVKNKREETMFVGIEMILCFSSRISIELRGMNAIDFIVIIIIIGCAGFTEWNMWKKGVVFFTIVLIGDGR